MPASKANKPNIKARRKRLLVLADWLENTVQPALNGAKWDMRVWAGKVTQAYKLYGDAFCADKFYDKETVPYNIAQAKECGYVGCAVGWGLTCPSLRKPLMKEASLLGGLGFEFRNLAKVFGISLEQAIQAFYASSYRSKKPKLSTVAKRLREIATAE